VKKRNGKGIPPPDDMNRGAMKKDGNCLLKYYGINIGYELRCKKKMEGRKGKIRVRITFVIFRCVFFTVKSKRALNKTKIKNLKHIIEEGRTGKEEENILT